MGFGPFLSKEEKARINASMKRNGNGLIQGVGERITPEENERRRRAASPEGMGLTQKDLGVGFGPFVSPAQKIQINNNLRQSQGGAYGPGGSPDGSGRGQARQGVRPTTTQAQKTEAINKAVGNWWQGLQTPLVGGAGAMMSGGSPTKVPAQSKPTVQTTKPPGQYPTNAELNTIKPSRDYQKEASIDLPTDDRHDTRIDSKGNIQTGTNTSPKPMTMDDANKLLSGGYKVENPYSSNQLPTTASSPYAGKSNSQIYNPETLHQHDSDVDYVSLSKDIYGDQSGVESYTRGGKMNKNYKQMDVNPGESVPEEKVNWANRTMADNSDEKVRRRSAFLDPNVNIMQAMRNQEAIQGRRYAGGKHWQRNKNAGQEGQNDFVEISAKQANDRSYYRQSADEVFANHLGKAKETVASGDIPDLPKDAPAPLPGAVPGNSNIDKSQLDTSDLMDMNPSESIIGNNTPSRTVKKGTLFNR